MGAHRIGRAGAVIGTVALCAVALVSGCSSSPARDVTGTDPAAHPSSPSAPPAASETRPCGRSRSCRSLTSSRTGSSESSTPRTHPGSHRVQVLDDAGTPRFGVDVPADRDEFAVTSTHNRELLITEDIDDSGSGAPATMTARDTRTGDLVWGPVSTAGCLTGAGLLIDADCSQTDAPVAVAAVSETDGHRTDLAGAVSESGGYRGHRRRRHSACRDRRYRQHRLVHRHSHPAPRSDPRERTIRRYRRQCSGRGHGRSRPVPNRSRRSIAFSDAEIRWISGSRSPMVVTADSSSGATMITTADLTDDGIAVLFEQYGTRGFTADQFPGADRFALVRRHRLRRVGLGGDRHRCDLRPRHRHITECGADSSDLERCRIGPEQRRVHRVQGDPPFLSCPPAHPVQDVLGRPRRSTENNGPSRHTLITPVSTKTPPITPTTMPPDSRRARRRPRSELFPPRCAVRVRQYCA